MNFLFILSISWMIILLTCINVKQKVLTKTFYCQPYINKGSPWPNSHGICLGVWGLGCESWHPWQSLALGCYKIHKKWFTIKIQSDAVITDYARCSNKKKINIWIEKLKNSNTSKPSGYSIFIMAQPRSKAWSSPTPQSSHHLSNL